MRRLREGAAVEPKLGKSTRAPQTEEKRERSDTSGAKWLSMDKIRFRANSPNLNQSRQLRASHEWHHFKTMGHLTAEQQQVFERKLSAAAVLKRHEIRSTN